MNAKINFQPIQPGDVEETAADNSANAANETFEFYLDTALTNPVVDAETFFVPVGISSQNVYIKIIDNNSLCARIDDVFTAGGPREPIKISFTAGSNSQAIPEVLPATTTDSKRAINILLRCFLTYSL